jgi:hypothetical protein
VSDLQCSFPDPAGSEPDADPFDRAGHRQHGGAGGIRAFVSSMSLQRNRFADGSHRLLWFFRTIGPQVVVQSFGYGTRMMQASARLAVMYRPISAPRAENVTLVSLPSAHLIIVRMEVMDASGVGGRGLYQHPRGSGLVDGSHHLGGRGLMHHVSDTAMRCNLLGLISACSLVDCLSKSVIRSSSATTMTVGISSRRRFRRGESGPYHHCCFGGAGAHR